MMHMRLWLVTGCALSLLAAPAHLAAQDTPPPVTVVQVPAEDEGPRPSDDMQAMAALAGMMGGGMKSEPLTPEQQARLPQAEAIIARIMPQGAMAEMSQQMFGGFLSGFGDAMPRGPRFAVADALGLGPADLQDVSEEDAIELAGLLDPAWKEREDVMQGLVSGMMGDMMNLMEPGMRKAMAELYAIRFTSTELAAIEAFFATEAGTKYARESISMASDPRLMSASMEALPAVFASLADMEGRMKERMAGLPEPRRFADLNPKERAQVAKLTGLSVEDLIRADEEVMAIEVPPPVAPQTD
jgi:hypothetical protein